MPCSKELVALWPPQSSPQASTILSKNQRAFKTACSLGELLRVLLSWINFLARGVTNTSRSMEHSERSHELKS